jgi:hemin uptake protein HemP
MKTGRNQEEQGIAASGATPSPEARRYVALVDHRLDSRELFASTREVTIAHGEDVYRLRLTAQNKLILTK